jgi:hypothetical protein
VRPAVISHDDLMDLRGKESRPTSISEIQEVPENPLTLLLALV